MEHPEWFLGRDEPPYPAYSFNGPNLSNDERVGIWLEDHYYDATRRRGGVQARDRWSGRACATCTTATTAPASPGTTPPSSTTCNPEAREAVIRTIIAVARRFPVIRFDAAMVAGQEARARGCGSRPRARRRHPVARRDGADPGGVRRGDARRVLARGRGPGGRGGARTRCCSRRRSGCWRATSSGRWACTASTTAPSCTCCATSTTRSTGASSARPIGFDARILGRYVNFMNNPDEKTAVDQFGDGDKYFGVATLLATMPGLPMVGHGQVEGFAEKYGMEFRRAAWTSSPTAGWSRATSTSSSRCSATLGFAGAREFRLYDVDRDAVGRRGRVRLLERLGASAVARRVPQPVCRGVGLDPALRGLRGQGRGRREAARTRSLAEGLGLDSGNAANRWVAFRDQRRGLEYLGPVAEIRERGLQVRLHAYESLVYWQFRELADTRGVRPASPNTLAAPACRPSRTPFRAGARPGAWRAARRDRGAGGGVGRAARARRGRRDGTGGGGSCGHPWPSGYRGSCGHQGRRKRRRRRGWPDRGAGRSRGTDGRGPR